MAIENLDFRVKRKKMENGRKSEEIVGLSQGELILLEIGRKTRKPY
jgi:hypothetical protein